MESVKLIVNEEEKQAACDSGINELSDMQLAFVGGGAGDVVFH